MIHALRRTGWFAAIFLAGILTAAILTTAHAATPTPTPAARLTCTKTAAVDDQTITWTLACTNTGNASQTVEVTDTLFSGPDWLIVPGSDSFGCGLTGSNTAGANKLECSGEVPKRIRDQFDDVVDGVVSVQVQGDVSTCGKFSNTGHFFYGGDDHKSSASAIVGCPATPAPTSTPSPTTPSPTTVPSATPTPQPQPASAPSSPTRVAPGPPNTGNTSNVRHGDSTLMVALSGTAAGVAMLGFGLAWFGVWWTRRAR